MTKRPAFFTLRLSKPELTALRTLARTYDRPIAQIIRDAISTSIPRHKAPRARSKPRPRP